MGFDRRGEVCEELMFAPALGMAMMEHTGIRKELDIIARKVDRSAYTLSTGMAAKAMVGTMFTEHGRKPLYGVWSLYATTPTDKVFGAGVTPDSLSDTSLADRLDTIFEMDMSEILFQSRERICDMYGLEPHVLKLDCTNYPLYGVDYRDPTGEAALPMYSGKSKVKRNDLLHKSVACVCDEYGLLMYSKAHDGNMSDSTMNREALEYLKDKVDASRTVITADSKFVNSDLIAMVGDAGMGFVSKVPTLFGNRIREDIVYSASGRMDPSETHPGRLLYDTDALVPLSNDRSMNLRFVAYQLPGGSRKAEEYYLGRGLKVVKDRMRRLSNKHFFCEDDARATFEDSLSDDERGLYLVTAEYWFDEKAFKEDPEDGPWRIRPSDVVVLESALKDSAEDYACNVLVTNLPRTIGKTTDIRLGATADKVVDLYLDQVILEHRFKFMKSETGVNRMFLHTPSRQDSVIFLSSLATLIASTIDTQVKGMRIKRKRMTTKAICDFLVTTKVRYDRSGDRSFISGRDGSDEEALGIVDALRLDPDLLIGF